MIVMVSFVKMGPRVRMDLIPSSADAQMDMKGHFAKMVSDHSLTLIFSGKSKKIELKVYK